MKLLFLSGVYHKDNEPEVIRNSKGFIDFAANIFQQKLLEGLTENRVDTTVLSTPFIGAFPTTSKCIWFRPFRDSSGIGYLPFCNLWGIRNFSRARAMKKGLKPFLREEDGQKLILVYSAHTPFLEAAVYAKKKDPRIRICLVAPDVPQYMNLLQKRSLLYDVLKKLDIRKMNRLMNQVDSFVLLTEQMTGLLPVGDKPYRVVEGILNPGVIEKNRVLKETLEKDSSLKTFVYTGTTNAKYGVPDLVEAFEKIPRADCRLVICGSGDWDEKIREAANRDPRILFPGQVPSEEARKWVLKADVLVNPRRNDEEYTKYSFPSKTLEYLSSENTVVGHLLDGMKPFYKEFLICPEDQSPDALAKAMEKALEEKPKSASFAEYAKNLTAPVVIQTLIDMNFPQ